MSDPHFREILEPLSELRQLTPPSDMARRSIHAARQAILSKRRTRMVRYAIISCASAAAVIAPLFFTVPRRQQFSIPVAAKPLSDPLKDAVQTSMGFRGVVQVRVEEMQLNSKGDPQSTIEVTNLLVNSSEGWTETATTQLPQQPSPPTMQHVLVQNTPSQHIEERVFPGRMSYVKTIPIPLTWQRGTVLIPTNPNETSIQPFVVAPEQSMTITREGNLQRYRIQPPGAASANDKKEANVWIDSTTGLVNRVQVLSRDNETTKIANFRYQYKIALESEPPATRPVGP